MANKVYIAVVGAGCWGKNHIRTLDELNALGAIVESNEINRNEIHSSQIVLFPIMGKIEMGIKKLKNIRNFVQYLGRSKIK